MDNKVALSLLVKMGGHSQQGNSWPLQTNMRLSAVEKDLNYCRVPTSSSECDSRLGILAIFRTRATGNLTRKYL